MHPYSRRALACLHSLDWPALKDAIKYLLKQSFISWPGPSEPILHPAAALISKDSGGADMSSTSSATSSDEAGPSLGAKTNGDHLDSHHVSAADLQAFFPSKRQAGPALGDSWGRRLDSDEDRRAEQRYIFGMLDDFEGQPPFTIQRLAELVLRPTEHHHTLAKYASALKRLLSVTATRDAFPKVMDEEDEDGVALGGDEEIMTNGFSSAASASSGRRSRSSTPVPGSPSTAPLFTPIPFLLKSGDEGMPESMRQGGGSTVANGVDGLIVERDVPGMELGGADRTTEQGVENARRSGAGSGSGKDVMEGIPKAAATTATSATPSATIDGIKHRPSEGEGPASSIAPPPEPIAIEVNSSSARDPTRPLIAGATAPSEEATPLGVPSGRVDELDGIGSEHGSLPAASSGGAKALTSTTVATENGAGSRSGPETEEDGGDEEEEKRALKRVRSDRNLAAIAKGQGQDLS